LAASLRTSWRRRRQRRGLQCAAALAADAAPRTDARHLEDMLAAPDLVDPASIEVRPYQGRFAVFANSKLLKADLAMQPLAHMWLRRHLCGNGQIIGYPQTIIEWIDASDQSRSAHSAPPQSSDPSPGRGKTKLPGQLSVSPREQCHDFLISAVPIGGAALFVVVVGAMAFR
jgi:hypothetical protein